MSGTAAANRINARKPRKLRALNGEFIDELCEAIRAGVRPEVAAPLNGVPSRTFEEWMQKARQPGARPLLVELADRVELSVAEWEAADILLIGKAARQENPGEWTAAAWRLERRLPSIYAKKLQVKGDITVDVIIQTPAFQELSERLMGALAGYPDALDAVIAEMGGQVVAGEAVEVKEISS